MADNGNLTILEALKTGLPFRRVGWSTLVKPHWRTAARYDLNGKCKYFTLEDIMANDWEVQIKQKTQVEILQDKVESLEKEIECLKVGRGGCCGKLSSCKCDNCFLKSLG